jgi:RNA polymerase sigma-70 factor, ECF subfamily
MGESRDNTVRHADGAAVRAVLAGDEDAFGVLVERCRLEFGRYAVAMLGDRDAAADAMQEAFIRAWDSLGDCRDPDHFQSWFFRILANQCRTALSRRRPRVDVDRLALPSRENTGAAAERGELAAALAAALGRLKSEQREAFVMKYVDERSYEEMAALLGVGEDALKMRVARARERLRKLLGDVR